MSRRPRWRHLSLLLLAILPSLSAEPIIWYKGIGADGKQPGERGRPGFTWTDNCFATSAYNSLYWFWLHGHDGMIPGGTSSTEDIENLWDNYLGGANAGSFAVQGDGAVEGGMAHPGDDQHAATLTPRTAAPPTSAFKPTRVQEKTEVRSQKATGGAGAPPILNSGS